MNARMRVAVIGVGHLGRHHARLLAGNDRVDLVAVVDRDRRRAEAVAPPEARVEETHATIVGRVDAVVVAVPTVEHLAVARDFLQAGTHVLVEKPIASSMAEADELVTLADRHGVVLAVGHSERFNPAVQAAFDVLRAPRFIEVHRLSGFPERSLDIDVVFDVMIHDLDLVAAIDGTPVVAVEAVGVPVLTSRVDIANARLKFASGCIANLTASRISREAVRKLRCFQPDMYVSVDAGARELEVYRLQRRDGERPVIDGGIVPVPSGEPLDLEQRDFLDAIETGRPPRVSGLAGRDALALATRVALAIESGRREA